MTMMGSSSTSLRLRRGLLGVLLVGILAVATALRWWFLMTPPLLESSMATATTTATDLHDLFSIPKLQRAVKKARHQLELDLRAGYGDDTFDAMFLDSDQNSTPKSRGRLFLTSPNHPVFRGQSSGTAVSDPEQPPGWTALVHKIALKIAQAHLSSSSTTQTTTPTTSFLWAQGGHSSSAGHGNFMSEAYMAVLTRRIQPVFAAVQVSFRARNYGMSATASAPELAACASAIYFDPKQAENNNDTASSSNTAVDVLSWDFGLTDSRSYWKMPFFFWRGTAAAAATTTTTTVRNEQQRPSQSVPTVPVFVALNVGGATALATSVAALRVERLADMERFHAFTGILVQNERVFQDCQAAIPDSSVNVVAEESSVKDTTTESAEEELRLQAMPPLIRNFKCRDFLETGDPYCGRDKWNTTMCTNRMHMVGWHPGWKTHALQGNLLALTLADALDEALVFLQQQLGGLEQPASSPTPNTLDRIVQQLQAQELETSERILNTDNNNDIPAAFRLPLWASEFALPLDVEPHWIWLQPNVCRTARMPARSRLLGVATNNNHILKQQQNGNSNDNEMENDSYYKGIPRIEAEREFSSDNAEMRLVQDTLRQDPRLTKCNETWRWDFQDNYYVHNREGWRHLVVPNDAEALAYLPRRGGQQHQLKGIILVCMTACNSRKCDPSQLFPDDVNEHGRGEMEVNGVPVQSLTPADACHFLKHANGHIWQPNAQGRFQVRVRVIEPNWFMLLSSIIVW
jgi:hypothetical protein